MFSHDHGDAPQQFLVSADVMVIAIWRQRGNVLTANKWKRLQLLLLFRSGNEPLEMWIGPNRIPFPTML